MAGKEINKAMKLDYERFQDACGIGPMTYMHIYFYAINNDQSNNDDQSICRTIFLLLFDFQSGSHWWESNMLFALSIFVGNLFLCDSEDL
jgi:hypothetical protein